MGARSIAGHFIRHPRALIDAILTYPRFLGTIKPELLGRAEAEARAYQAAYAAAIWPRHLSVPVGKRLLVIAPHPDDETIGCGGLLLKHRGVSEIHVVTVFNGEGGGRLPRGPWENTSDYKKELVRVREAEMRDVAAKLRVSSLQHLNFPDGATNADMIAAHALRNAIDRVTPEVILLPWYLDNNYDHRLTNVLYAWGSADVNCMVLAYEIWRMLEPNAVIDIGDRLAEKLELVSCYASQTATIDYAGLTAGLAHVRAFYAGINPARDGAAEAYMALPNCDYCELVHSAYGGPYELSPAGRKLLG